MSQSSPNPFFSQDRRLSQLDYSITSVCTPILSQQDDIQSFDISSWVENVVETNCCSKLCMSNVDKDDLTKLKETHLSLSKQQQELVILTLLQSFKKSRKENHRESFVYSVYPFGTICRNSFRSIFGISNGVLVTLCNHLKQNGITPRIHGNSSRLPHNALSETHKEQIIQWIASKTTRRLVPRNVGGGTTHTCSVLDD